MTEYMMDENVGSARVRLETLYVQLGKIGGLDGYVSKKPDPKKQVEAFNSDYETLLKKDSSLLETALKGKITAKDIGDETENSFSGEIEIEEETLLHRAISIIGYKDKSSYTDLEDIIKKLIEDVSSLLTCDRKDSSDYKGQIPLHLAVLKEDKKLVEIIVEAMVKKGISLDQVATGSKFEGTVMMAGTPLCVAALTLNRDIFMFLVEKGANIAGTNKDDENVCHSLVRYAHHRPDKLDNICTMLDYILQCTLNKEHVTDTQALLMMENNDGLNPLQLVAKFHLHQIFKQLFGYEVYCKKNLRNALQDDQWYDVTEIDTIPVSREENGDNKEGHVSLLPTILLQSPRSAIKFLEFPPVRQVIKQKWNRYRWFIGAWGILHLAFMVLLTVAAVRRANLTNNPISNPNETLSDRPNFIYKVRKDIFVTVISVIGFIFSFAYICLQITRYITGRYRKSLKLTDIYKAFKYPHSNILYKCMFILFSACLILDFIIAVIQVDTYENYMLMAAVIMGSYLLLFFIQMIKPFSFFTALIQIVMVDLARFAIVMIIFLVGFSTAMYMVMQGADSLDDTFLSYDSTVMKMFHVMLGLGDIESLSKARHPFAAVVVFVVFVLLTTIMLLNALLAIMANTCSNLLSRYGDVTAYKMHYRLHKLSTILFVEDILPQQLQVCVGKIQQRKRYKKGKTEFIDVGRRMIHLTTFGNRDLHVGYTQEPEKSGTRL